MNAEETDLFGRGMLDSETLYLSVNGWFSGEFYEGEEAAEPKHNVATLAI